MFKFYGHNSFKFSVDNATLITDPWLSKKGAFISSWFQYPKNHHLLKTLATESRLENKEFYIFISHEHQDHLDIDTLEHFSRSTKIFIPNYKDDFLYYLLTKMGFECIFLEDSEEFFINKNFSVKAMISDIGINRDAAILIKTPSFVFFNQNDCKVFDRLNEIEEKVDFYSVQYSGANWHPSAFMSSPRRKKIISEQKVLNKMNNVLNAIKELNPKYYIPSAGPPIFPFLDENLNYGDGNIFVHQDKLASFFNENNIGIVKYMRPGEEFNPSKHNLPISPPTIEELEDYKKDIYNKWDEFENKFTLSGLIASIVSRLEEIKDILLPQTPMLVFRWGEGRENALFIDLNTKSILEDFDYKTSYQEILADEKYFYLMEKGHRWQDLALTLRAKIVRRPDVYCNFINIFIFSDIENIRESFLSSLNIPLERVEVLSDNGKKYSIDRYCPHQGADLCSAQIKDNKLICPRHGWIFDLDNLGNEKNSIETINAVNIKSK